MKVTLVLYVRLIQQHSTNTRLIIVLMRRLLLVLLGVRLKWSMELLLKVFVGRLICLSVLHSVYVCLVAVDSVNEYISVVTCQQVINLLLISITP